MALDIDTNRRLGPSELEQLVEAVARAHEDEPERDALEWKRTLDLNDAKHRFDLARHILGMGNRSPHVAAATFGGYAYILVGVEPGGLKGCDVPDPGDLVRRLSSLISPGHPGWRLELVRASATTVVAIEVDPPRPGDRICTLLKGNDQVQAGAIFIRRQGTTGPARPEDIRMLEERFSAPDAQAGLRRQALEERRLALDEARDERERIDRAIRDAPKFAVSPRSSGFLGSGREEVRGLLRNVGASAANVQTARLHREAVGAVPAAMVPVYGSPSLEPGPSARVEVGVDLQLSFKNAILADLKDEPLSIHVHFADDAGVKWRSVLPLRRRGSMHDQPLWVIPLEQVEHRRE